MTDMEIINLIKGTFEKSGCKLTEDQEAVLAGSLMVWFGKIRELETIRITNSLQEVRDILTTVRNNR